MKSVLLALDLGKRRTGVALKFGNDGLVVACSTIHTEKIDELFPSLMKIIEHHAVTHIAIGLPLLPGGAEGEQVAWVKDIGEKINQTFRIPIIYVDERYTSKGAVTKKHADALAACSIADAARI